MSTRGNEAFVAAMRRAHPEKKFTGRVIVNLPEPVIPVQNVSDEVPKPAKPVVKDVFHTAAHVVPRISMTDTIIKVAGYLGQYSEAQIKGRDQHKHIVRWRQVCWFVMSKHIPAATTPYIAKRFNRDHSTVVHGLQKIRARYHEYQEDIELLESFL